MAMVKAEGIVIRLLSGFYTVAVGETIVKCRARGVLRKRGESPLVGDRVEISVDDNGETGMVDSIFERKNHLIRPAAANIDRIVIVSSFCIPAPNLQIIDRMTVIAQDAGIDCVIVFNKSDLGNVEPYSKIYRKAGFETVVVSAETGEGIEELKKCLQGGINVFTGNTGVGKSSLLNRLLPEEDLKTGEVSEKLGRGRHTTRHVELYRLSENTLVADTPGFSSLAFGGHEFISSNTLQFAFPDFSSFLGECRFPSCVHISESGCAIKSAVDRGDIVESRYNSYAAMYDEVKDIKDWERNRKKTK